MNLRQFHKLIFLGLTILFIFCSTSLQSQQSRYFEFQLPPVLTSQQWTSLEMDKEDQGLLVYVSDYEEYYLFSSGQWVEMGNGGDVIQVINRNKERLNIRTAAIDNLQNPTIEEYRGVLKLEKKQWQILDMESEDQGLLLYAGDYMLYSNGEWRNLGGGGNFGKMMNRQKSITGLKEGFLYNWRQKFGIGLFAGLTYSSFYRDEKYPSNPLISGIPSGYEIGLSQNLVYKSFFQSMVYLSYQNNKIEEIFSDNNGNTLTANWQMAGPNIGFMPIMLTPGTKDFKLTLGGGAYARYYTTRKIIIDSNQDILIDPIADTEQLDFGFRAQIGFQIYRFTLNFYMTNQYNNLLTSDWVELLQERRNIQTRSYNLNFQFNF